MVLPYVFAFLFLLWLASIPFIVAYYSKQERNNMWDNYGEHEAFIANADKPCVRHRFRMMMLSIFAWGNATQK